MLTDAQFRHALLDPHVEKRRVMIYARGVYVKVTAPEAALRERDVVPADGELDLPRPAEYYLPELAFQRVRQRR